MTGTASMTSKQKRDLRRLASDALDEARLDRVSAQKLYGKGGAYKAGIKKLIAELTASDLLKSITTVVLPATDTFITKDFFKEDRDGEAGIGWLGSNFKRYFLGKIEEAVPETTLRTHQLVKVSVDKPIIAELGGEETVETMLSQMYKMMKRQVHGEKGDLLVNFSANIFYVKDIDGQLWSINCNWDSGDRYWGVEAYSLADPYAWRDGSQIISRRF